MSTLRHLIRHPHHLRRRFTTATASAFASSPLVSDPIPWTRASVSNISPAAECLFQVTIDVSRAPHLFASHTRPGQYLQLRIPGVSKPSYLAIASPPSLAAAGGQFEFLVASVPGSTAQLLCRLKRGDAVELSGVMGRGFDVDRIDPPQEYPTVLMFATGSGISPIRSLIESGFDAIQRSDVRLYYGVMNLRRMAYQDRFKDWEASGIKVVPVLSDPDSSWNGETGTVQSAFCRAKNIYRPLSTGAVLCGHRQMREDDSCEAEFDGVVFLAQEVTSILVKEGVRKEKILKNF